MSTSSLGTLAKSPSSLTASLSASVALYDSHQPPKTLQDILLLAQSHYISHRYVPALTLYRLAAEKHHSLPACCSLYALYTSTVKTPGLVRSDTKATEVLIHALRIWTARRWSSSLSSLDGNHSSMRSKTRDDHAELEEYFAHPRSASNQQRSGRSSAKNNNNSNGTGASIPISSRRDSAPRPIVAESIESEYRRPGLSHQEDRSASEDSESGSESGSDDEDADEDDDSEEEDCDSECEECQNCEGGCEHCEDSEEEEEDEEQAKEEEARRIGLATMEIEDIVQKLCSMIQKGVLGLDEAVVIEAISMVRKIERGLSKDTEAWQAQMAKSKSLFESSLSGGKTEGESGGSSSGTAAGLLLTQSIDLSFLNLTPESTSPMSQVRAVDLSSRKRAKATASISTPSKHPVNAAISRLSIGEQEADQAICRAMRIRIMFTLGWVHQQRGEYHWGAQAYGVCSEVIPPPGKRLLVSLQQQATVQKWTCLAFEKKAQEQQAQAEEERQRALAEQQQQKPERIPSPPASTQQQQQRRQPRKLPTSPSYTSSEVSTAAHHHADISSPSSYSSSESAAVSIRGGQTGTTISSLSAAMWSSGLFKSSTTPSEALIPTAPATTAAAMVGKPASPAGTLSSVQSDPTSKSSTSRQLHRSKSVSLGLKINTLNSHEVPQETKEKEPHHHQHHHPRAQHRAKGHHQHGQGAAAAAAAVAAAVLTMTMSDHQKKVVKCGHCGQKRILMPLCVCKKVRYCNRECRIADLEAHRKTGCHAALMSTSGGSTSSSGSGSAAAATAAAAAAAGLQVGPGMSM
ncbi:hypothetical protein BGZ68_007356 [Mortierella alpina]|nr:hypothetical protein BGZ68_007356 [Mortierella alpina]